MLRLRKTQVIAGVYWVEAPSVDVRILCGCPADVVKHLMKRGLIAPQERDGIAFETGPNVVLLSDVMVQNGAFSNLAEFPVLQMLYRQGMILPNHPGNTGRKPLLVGSGEQVRAQLQYIYRGNYGLVSEDELIEAGQSPDQAREMMRLKLKFAFGAIRHPSDLLDSLIVDNAPVEIKPGLTLRRIRLNLFEFALGDERVTVDLNLEAREAYESPYPLGFYDIPREYFAVVHSGEGDGWDINRPCMSSILMFQGRIYLIDCGPNVLGVLNALGIGVNEIEGVFHTHSHDDHFAGLTTLVRADHRLKYYATPLVAAAVVKKMAALLSIQDSAFGDFFDVHLLDQDCWNDVDGLEVLPIFSPHPVETTLFHFRAMWEGGYRTYAHCADICRVDVLRSFVTEDDQAPGLSQAMFDRVIADYHRPAHIKKVDIGGGMIHGDANDFRDDPSGKIILAHTAQPLTAAQRAIGSAAAFGKVDCLIQSGHDVIWRLAFEVLRSAFPDVPDNQLRALMNNPMVTFQPGDILLKDRHTPQEVWVILSGSVEAVSAEGGVSNVLSSGAIVGEMTGLFASLSTETYRALGFVKTLKISCALYGDFVRRNDLFLDISRLMERREFLQRTRLFREVVSVKALNRIVREVRKITLAPGEESEVSPDSMCMVVKGKVGRFVGERRVGTVGPGDYFGEETSIFWTPSMFRMRVLEQTEALILPAAVLADIPSVRWRLLEVWSRRMSTSTDDGESNSLNWSDDHLLNVVRLDNEHRWMVDLVNVAQNAALGTDSATLAAALEALDEYANYHFGEEEAVLERTNYPCATIHRQSHAQMAAVLTDLRHEVLIGLPLPNPAAAQMLREWLLTHLAEDDRAIGPFLNAKGIY
jgi:hemerythrin